MALKVGNYKICLMDLVVDKNGKLSGSQCWYHAANILISKKVYELEQITPEIILNYGLVVGGCMTVLVWIKYRYGGANANNSDTNTLP